MHNHRFNHPMKIITANLIWTFSSVRSHMPFQFREFHTCIITVWTTMRFLKRVSITNVPYQFSRSCKGCITSLKIEKKHCIYSCITFKFLPQNWRYKVTKYIIPLVLEHN